jgi:class 3 adenylate cyclase
MPRTHKTATVLFTDLVASTQLVQRVGPDRASEVLARHFAALRDALAVHRGSEVKTLGDGIMAVFDSVTDGLACAVTMQRAVARQNRLDSSIHLQIRIGLATGETSFDGEDYFGQPVIQASRLCAEAAGGGILVSDLTRMLADSDGMHRRAGAVGVGRPGRRAPSAAQRDRWGRVPLEGSRDRRRGAARGDSLSRRRRVCNRSRGARAARLRGFMRRRGG